MTRLLLIHFTPPGVVGGAEHIIHQHIELLRQRGYQLEVVAGRAEGASVPVQVLPEINVAAPAPVRVEAELAVGVVSPEFHRIRRQILRRLSPLVARTDVVIAHNAFTLHFSLPLTAALWELAGRGSGMISWSHDLSWCNPLYQPILHPGYPWDLLRLPAPHTHYVTVSETRAEELAALWAEIVAPLEAIPNGIDPAHFLRLSPETGEIVRRFGLFECDLVLLLPVRVTRRKNIEAGIRVVRELKARGRRVRFLVTGPAASHHPGRSHQYLEELLTLRRELEVEQEVIFLAHELGHTLASETVAELYSVSDVLLLLSASEGFGLPALEAGLARVPAVVSDIAIFREVFGPHAAFIPPSAPPGRIVELIESVARESVAALYRRVLHTYRWDTIIDRQVVPLLEAAALSARRTDHG